MLIVTFIIHTLGCFWFLVGLTEADCYEGKIRYEGLKNLGIKLPPVF